MAWSENDRVVIRYYLGYADLWLQVDPRLESAISNIQAVSAVDPAATGGTRPDQSAENQVRMVMAKLQDIDTRMDALDDMMGVEVADGNRFDVVREDLRLRRKGRMYVYRLAKLLDTEPRADVFASSPDVGGNRGGGSGGFRSSAAYANIGGNNRTAY